MKWYWRPTAWLIDHGILTLREGDFYRNARVAPLSWWFKRSGIEGTI